MDKKSRILILIFIVSIFISIFFTHKRAFIDQDFIIEEGEMEEETTEEVDEEIQ